MKLGKRPLTIGTLRPNILLFGETTHPSVAVVKSIEVDLSKRVDLLLIIGTSLKVDGMKTLVKHFAKVVHSNKGVVIFLNKDRISKRDWEAVIDYWVQGDCDAWAKELVARMGGGSVSKSKKSPQHLGREAEGWTLMILRTQTSSYSKMS